MADKIANVARALCQSGKFETGEGTCALLCLDVLGNARGGPHGCPHVVQVHGDLARATIEAAEKA